MNACRHGGSPAPRVACPIPAGHNATVAVRAVLVDWGGVISTPPVAAFEAWERDMGYSQGTLVRVFPLERLEDMERGKLTLTAHLAGLSAADDDFDDLRFDCDAFQEWAAGTPFGVHWMVVDCLRDIKRAGMRLALVTNVIPEWVHLWRQSVPDGLFDVALESCTIGIRKPELSIYRLACERLGADPTECVFVDDTEDNVLAAEELGMRGLVARADPWEVVAELRAACHHAG